jgi:Uma2 family endonuclease
MVATRHISIEEFERMSLEGRWELLDGELVEMSPSAGPSSRYGGRIYARIQAHVEPSGIGLAYPADAGFILFGDRAVVRSPDAAFVRHERLPVEPDSFVPLAPDFAAEVLSPTDRRADALAKIAMYLQAGVQLVWLVDPDRRTVTVFRIDEPMQIFTAEDVLDFGEVIPGLSFPVAEIFA